MFWKILLTIYLLVALILFFSFVSKSDFKFWSKNYDFRSFISFTMLVILWPIVCLFVLFIFIYFR